MKRTIPLLALTSWLACAPLAAAPLDEMQGQAILQELKAIRALLERIEGQGGLARRAARPSPPGTATVSVSERPALGSDDAPVTLVEFTDYQCPYCRRFFQTVYPALKRKYIDTGKVRLVLKNLPLPMHADARGAAEAALCAGEQGRYWEMHDRLFSDQSRLAPPQVAASAAALGIDQQAFTECLSSDRHLASVEADLREAGAQSIGGTPTFVVGHTASGGKVDGVRIVGAQPVERFEQHIEALLARPPG